jgi:hypothetical protein
LAIVNGEALFAKIGCASCHIPNLPRDNWIYTEPNPYNPASDNLSPGDVPTFTMDLMDRRLPHPRLTPLTVQSVWPHSPISNQPAGSPGFFEGNFVTKRLWSIGSSLNHFHHG